MNHRPFISSLIILFFVSGLYAQNPKVEDLQPLLDSLCLEAGYPGATMTVVLSNGEELKMAYGMADLEKQIPMPVDARMFSGSTGKTFASAIACS